MPLIHYSVAALRNLEKTFWEMTRADNACIEPSHCAHNALHGHRVSQSCSIQRDEKKFQALIGKGSGDELSDVKCKFAISCLHLVTAKLVINEVYIIKSAKPAVFDGILMNGTCIFSRQCTRRSNCDLNAAGCLLCVFEVSEIFNSKLHEASSFFSVSRSSSAFVFAVLDIASCLHVTELIDLVLNFQSWDLKDSL